MSQTPGPTDWQARVGTVLREEAASPLGWWWLSFTDATRPTGSQFLGVAVVQANGIASASIVAHSLGINPGGEMLAISIPDEHLPPEDYRNRLLSKAEAESLR